MQLMHTAFAGQSAWDFEGVQLQQRPYLGDKNKKLVDRGTVVSATPMRATEFLDCEHMPLTLLAAICKY